MASNAAQTAKAARAVVDLPPNAFVAGARDMPFQKRPGLGSIPLKMSEHDKARMLFTFHRTAPSRVDEGGLDIQSMASNYYELPDVPDDLEMPPLEACVDGIATDTGDSGKELLPAWFEKMSTAAQRTPLYSFKKDAGVVQEAKAEQGELPEEEQADVDALETSIKEKERQDKKRNRIFGRSPAHGCLVLADGKLIVPYSQDTINAAGNYEGSPFSTLLSFTSHDFLPGHVYINFNLSYGAANIQIASVKIPLKKIQNNPSTKVHDMEEIGAYLDSLRIEHSIGGGAYTVHLSVDTSKTTVSFREQAFRELHYLGMPYLQGLRQDITRVFDKRQVTLTFLVPDGWEDFASWVQNLSALRAHAMGDPLRPLKKLSGPYPINRKNYNSLVDTDIPFAPALTAFDTVDQCMTILGDGIAREHKFQEWGNAKLATIDCKASLIPVGSRKIVIETNGVKKTKPLVYCLTIHKSDNSQMLDELMPPVGAHVKVQVQLEYAPIERPQENKTPEQVYLIISRELHEAIWNHRRPPTARAAQEQAWVDDYAKIVMPYIKPEVKAQKPGLAQAIAYEIAYALNKKRGNKKENIKGESAKEHKARTIACLREYPGILYLPPDTMAEIPEMPGVRYSFPEPLSQAGQPQFLVKTPRHPKWPRSEAANAPVPFIDFRQQKLPNKGSKVDVVNAARRLPDKKLIPCRITFVYSDDTARSMEHGIYKMQQYHNAPIVNWCSTFQGEPITSDVTDNFSVLKRCIYELVYRPALPFNGYDVVTLQELDSSPGYVYPAELTDENGKVIAMTTQAFQAREDLVTGHLVSAFQQLTPEQFDAVKLLVRLPFGMLVIEGCPGSGKTTAVALKLFVACLHSSLKVDISPNRHVDEYRDEEEDWDTDSELDEDDVDAGVDFSMRPTWPEQLEVPQTQDMPADAATETQALPQPGWVSLYDFPPLTMGPTKTQMEKIVTESVDKSVREIIAEIYDAYTKNYMAWKTRMGNTVLKPYNNQQKGHFSRIMDRRHVRHFEEWVVRVCDILDAEETREVLPEAQTKKNAELTVEEAMAFHEQRLQTQNTTPLPQPTNLQGMIIANQNINGDDLAKKIKAIHEELGEKVTIIRVTNLERERDSLIQSYRPARGDYTEDSPSIADILEEGMDDETVNNFVDNMGEFKNRKHGGNFNLEAIMRSMIRRNQKPKLKRELERLRDGNVTLTKEEMKQLKVSIDELIREILDHTHVVVCTFHVAQTLYHKKLFSPQVVWVDEASREHEALIRWAQLALTPHLLILTGDAEQDKPFCLSNNLSPNHKDPVMKTMINIFKAQYGTAFGARFKKEARKHMIFLSENFRQHGGLELLSSELFYDGEMKSRADSTSTTALKWYQFAQNFIKEEHIQRPPKHQRDQCAEFLTHNRITYAVRSNRTMIGLSSVDEVQARRAADLAALVHQAGIPGEDGRRPTICIITPYSAQVDEIRKYIRKLSDQEFCKDLVEVRTQTAATGGEWDVVINVFVRDEKMGFLSEHHRLNVMWTRARYLDIDIMNNDFFQNAKGKGSQIMRAYHDETIRNGALVVDKRNWNNVCDICFEAHPPGCQQSPKCTFCGEGHHARKCSSKENMTVTIPENRQFVLQPMETNRPQAPTNFVTLEDRDDDAAEEPAEEDVSARRPDAAMHTELTDYIASLNVAPLQFQEPATVQPIEEEDIYGVSGEEDEGDSSDDDDVAKIKLTKEKRQRITLDAEQPAYIGVGQKKKDAETDNAGPSGSEPWNATGNGQDTNAQDANAQDGNGQDNGTAAAPWANNTNDAAAAPWEDKDKTNDAGWGDGKDKTGDEQWGQNVAW